ncbi:hypothetical protein K1W54_29815 [Micromonospora sp. CPCC 205371]|nr:hypothetical protein [Micromonospora sp. CPCC 205371]
MANTEEMRRLMLHAADLLDAQTQDVREAFRDQHAHAACTSSGYTAGFSLGPLAEWAAASSLAQSVLRMVAAAIDESED